MKRSLLMVILAIVLMTLSAMAQESIRHYYRARLKGIDTNISVLVDHYRGEEEQARQLRTEIELRLRQAGIQVGPGPDSALLILGRHSPPYYQQGFCSIQAELSENGKFERRQGLLEIPAITWESSLNHTTHRFNTDDWESAHKILTAAVDEFINDYLTANQTKDKSNTD